MTALCTVAHETDQRLPSFTYFSPIDPNLYLISTRNPLVTLTGKNIAILIAPRGTEDAEFTRPKAAVMDAGASVTGPVQPNTPHQATQMSLRDLDDAAILLRDMARLVFEEDALPLDHSPK
jgi:hypothetical protein